MFVGGQIRGFYLFGVLLFIAGLVLAFTPSPANATINNEINFQGKLANPDGTNVTDGSYSIRFRIYNHASNDGAAACAANSCLWEETQGTVAVDDGIFRVALGSSTALPGSVDFNTAGLYLGVKVGSDAEMTPRIQFTAAPYAFNSDRLNGLASSAFGQLASSQTWTGTNTFQPTTNISSAIVRQTSFGSPTSDIFNIQTANTTNILQVTGPTANEAAVTLNSVGATRALTLDSASGTLVLGANTTTIQKSGVALTVDVNSGSASTVTITNAGAGVASLSVEGDITTTNTIYANSFDRSTNGALVVGGTNATSIAIGNSSSSLTLNADSNGVLIKPTDGTSAFQVQRSSNSDVLLTADTTNNRVVVGNAAAASGSDTTLFVVDSATTANAPVGVNGGIYYDTDLANFQCFQAGSWGDCFKNIITSSSSSTANFTSGRANVTASQSGLAVETLIFTSATGVSNTAGSTGFTAPADGSFRTCLIKNNAAITTGTLDLRWRVNGASVGSAACSMDSIANRESATALDSGVVTFSAGDTIGIAFDTNGTYAPATIDYTVYWSVEYESSTGSALNMQFVYDSSSSPATITTANAKDLQFDLANTATDANFIINALSGSASRFAVQNNGTDVLSVNPGSGDITIGNSAGGTLTVGASSGSDLVLEDSEWSVTGAGAANFSSIDTGSGNIVTTGTIGSAGAATFTGAGATFTGSLAANGGITLGANEDLTTTAGTGTITVNSTVSNASDDALTVAPSFAGGATDGLAYNAMSVGNFAPTNAAGTDTVDGLNIGTMTDPGATITSTAIDIGAGWDTGIRFNDTTPTIRLGATDNTGILSVVDVNSNTLVKIQDHSTNFGASVEAGAFIDYNSMYADEFFKDRAQVAADGNQNWGDNTEWSTGETGTCLWNGTADAINGVTTIVANAAASTCTLTHNDLGAATANLWLDADNLPTLLMKVRPSVAGAGVPDTDHQFFAGMSDGGMGAAPASGAPTNGIYFSNASNTAGTTGTANWYAVTDDGGASTNTACGVAVSETQFALLMIKVLSTSLVEFYIDGDVSDGVNMVECGTGNTTDINTAGMTTFLKSDWDANANASTLEVDFFRVWQDDAATGQQNASPSVSDDGQLTNGGGQTLGAVANNPASTAATAEVITETNNLSPIYIILGILGGVVFLSLAYRNHLAQQEIKRLSSPQHISGVVRQMVRSKQAQAKQTRPRIDSRRL